MKITLKRSLIGTKKDHRDTVKALGLRKVGQSRDVVDNPSIRGMIHKVAYLLEVEE
ncbi:MAG: 50S ribosomal protein L30 [Deinococcales bacterium]